MTISRFERLARRLTLVLGLGAAGAGCDAAPLDPDTLSTSAAVTPASTPVMTGPAPTTSAAAPAPDPAPLDSLGRLEAEVEAENQLARLRALQIVVVRGLVLGLPDRATACGGPCGDVAWRQLQQRAYESQAPRLAALVRDADQAVHGSYYSIPVDMSTVEGDLASLNALGVVELGGLLAVKPANNPRCYGQPCPEDVTAAETATGVRAFQLRAWASSTSTKSRPSM